MMFLLLWTGVYNAEVLKWNRILHFHAVVLELQCSSFFKFIWILRSFTSIINRYAL
jgi:hypothetical protein